MGTPTYLTPAQYVGACAVYPYSVGLEAAFACMDRFGNPYNMAVRVDNHLYVPRNYAPPPTPLTDKRVVRPTLPALECKCGPKDEDQARAINESIQLLHKGNSHIIEAPTGWGKSYAGSAVANAISQPTLIVVTKQDLMDEWHKTLVTLIGIDPKDIGKVQQNTCTYEGKRFVIAMVHSLVKPGKYDEAFYRSFGMMLLDEVHLMGAETFVRCCQIIPAKLRLGLSATPDRSDGKMDMVKAHIGPVLVKGTVVPMIPKILVKQTKWKIPRKLVKLSDGTEEWQAIPHAPGQMTHITKIMAANKERNAEIVKFVCAAFSKGRRTLIVSDLTDHLDALHLLIGKEVGGENIGYYVGGKSKIELEHAAAKRVILGTYKMVEYGTNQPQWDTLVMATPRKKSKQTLGRVLRQLDGKLEPVALDLVDEDPVFQGYYRNRLVEYYSLKANIVKM